MRPLPLWLPSLLLCGLGAAASSPASMALGIGCWSRTVRTSQRQSVT
uniref:Interferon gamma receptor 2 n=1 Tax=Mus musculus TaxID=10090 RepID=D6RIP6_MOUSE